MEKIRLNTAQITPGMKLGEPITNANGVTLMPAGIRLTPMFIARIRKWNIEFLEVYVEKKAEAAEAGAADADDAQNGSTSRSGRIATRVAPTPLSVEMQEFAHSLAIDVSRAFVNVKDNPLMMELRAAVIKRLVKHGPNGIINVIRASHGKQGEESPNGA